jgi:hypothetical protein
VTVAFGLGNVPPVALFLVSSRSASISRLVLLRFSDLGLAFYTRVDLSNPNALSGKVGFAIHRSGMNL